MTAHPSAAEILARVVDVYAQARTYEDEGEDVTLFIQRPRFWRRRKKRTLFHTAFIRPDRLRFEFREAPRWVPEANWTRWIAWTDSGVPRIWSTVPGVTRTLDSIGSALASLTGVSSGVAGAVPALLLPEMAGRFPLPDPASARCLGRERIERSQCWRLEGRRFENKPVSVWIDTDSFLLRRITRSHEFNAETHELTIDRARQHLAGLNADDPSRALMERAIDRQERREPQRFSTKSTTTWRPRIDVELDASALRFDPPAV